MNKELSWTQICEQVGKKRFVKPLKSTALIRAIRRLKNEEH